ncbi:restriction endonuclease [Thalassolituus alkanivorans]|uniref:restriction endonuclease n=1 Tax=Thalassolituus alkanivorans TaxID=2881055 RepID=UPI001E5EDD54|nr:restriction endonuclease [Thalassolituus alkanivorans]MCB2387043.1 restriction endonuclease [Thalassolituus alkanivorans]MCB2421601.1 restriction endonuclease [Thalassolituus alkanivorans]
MIKYQYPPLKSWDDFEELCSDLFKREWNDDLAQRYGRQGSTQHGVDIYGKSENSGKYTGIQCKGKQIYPEKNIDIEEIKMEIEKAKLFPSDLQTLIFVTTAPRTTKVQDYIRSTSISNRENGLFDVGVLFWDDIESLINKHKAVAERFYGSIESSNVKDSDRYSIKRVKAGLNYESFIVPLKEEPFYPNFDSRLIYPLYDFIELERNPNVYFSDEEISYIFRRLTIVAKRIVDLVGRHSFPCNPPKGSYIEIPYKDYPNGSKHQKLMLDTIEELIFDSSEFFDTYILFMERTRALA